MRAFALAALLLTTVAAAPAPDPSGERWWSHIAEIASDRYEGRLTGTPGYDRAAAYVAGQFRELGLREAGTQGYLQPVAFVEQHVDQAASRLALSGAGGARPLAIGDEALLGTRFTQPATVDAPLVFIGYGLALPEAGADDFAGLDLKGKIVVYLNGGPANLSAALKSHSRAAAFGPALERAGAVGVISIANPKSMDIPWSRIRLSGSQPGMQLADQALRDVHRPMFSAALNPAEADKLFAPAGHRFADLLALADAGAAMPRFDLGQRLSGTIIAESHPVSAPNVVARLQGTDPALGGEYVIVSAHLDHLGIGEPIGGDRIYNGAMDNASGIASMLECARALAAHPPKRSVIFLAVTAEEKGLLGSRYYANRPTVPPASIAADVNMDMFLPIFPLTKMVAYGADQSSLGAAAQSAATSAGVTLAPDPAPDRNLFVRSDQYSFIRTGVPSLSLKFEPATPAQKALESGFLANRYHAPSDDIAQPVDKPAAAKFNVYLVNLIEDIADAPARPTWNADSFFRRFAR